ncbi:MAG: TIGR02757 family protein [Muribaculaceae bacterium]|nr:TIGR02757 family protein [Muribaculaceae bacterium]
MRDFSDKDLKDFLDREAARINTPEFIGEDPVQFPRRFEKLQDIEIVAFLSAIIAWGRRSMICRDAERMLSLMEQRPFDYVMDEGYAELDPRMNIHRTMFASDLQYFLRGLRKVFSDYGSLDAFCAAVKAGDDAAPSWKFVEELQKVMCAENDGKTCSQCLPVNLKTTALKRINMALRWLVRDDGIVDMGVWTSIPKSKLFIPLDVHVGNTARDLGLLTRKANDRKSVEEVMETLRRYRPDDPAIYDYALFGIGIENSKARAE